MSAPVIFLDTSVFVLSSDKHFDALSTIVRIDPVVYLAELGKK
jgi:hypothetical protein